MADQSEHVLFRSMRIRNSGEARPSLAVHPRIPRVFFFGCQMFLGRWRKVWVFICPSWVLRRQVRALLRGALLGGRHRNLQYHVCHDLQYTFEFLHVSYGCPLAPVLFHVSLYPLGLVPSTHGYLFVSLYSRTHTPCPCDTWLLHIHHVDPILISVREGFLTVVTSTACIPKFCDPRPWPSLSPLLGPMWLPRPSLSSSSSSSSSSFDWWFGTFSIFPIILGMSSSQLTNSYFSEGWPNHQPDHHHHHHHHHLVGGLEHFLYSH